MNTLLEHNAKAIEKAREEMAKEITNKIMAVFLVIGKEWQNAHPKRHLKLVAGMGAAFWTIDDAILHLDHKMYSTDSWYTIKYESNYSCSWDGWKNYGISDHEKQKQFTTLCQAFDWLNGLSEKHEYLDRYLSDIDFKNI